ncbi:hypothetical protein L7F22_049339 [Adiantum nelumboides]|nr:hypothetical protein [Adiantum nelumboides]
MGRHTSALALLASVSLMAASALMLYTLLIAASLRDVEYSRLREVPFTLHDSPFAIPSYEVVRNGGGGGGVNVNRKLKLGAVDPVGYRLAVHYMEHAHDDHLAAAVQKPLPASRSSSGLHTHTAAASEPAQAYQLEDAEELEIIDYPEDFLLDLMREDPLYEPFEELMRNM